MGDCFFLKLSGLGLALPFLFFSLLFFSCSFEMLLLSEIGLRYWNDIGKLILEIDGDGMGWNGMG